MFIQLLHEDAILHPPATKGSAGFDLSSIRTTIIQPNKREMVQTGIAVQLPWNAVGLVCIRSSLAFKHGITILNSPGIIDSDYRGEIKLLLYNSSNSEFVVKKGNRIAQLVPVVMSKTVPTFTIVDQLPDNTSRGINGIGSTGK